MKNLLLKFLLLSGIFLPPGKGYSQNLLIDGSFSTTTSITPFFNDPPPLFQWAAFSSPQASFTTNVQNGIVSYSINNPGAGFWEVQLDQFGFSLQLNHRYRLSFDVKADADRDFGVFIGQHGGIWANLNPSYIRHATVDWQTITIDINSIFVFPMYQLSFEMGTQAINMYFDNISLIDLGPIPIDKVVIAGTFQHGLGCANDWDPNCDFTALTHNSSTGLWTGAFNVPPGCHQYKAVVNGDWNISYGENGGPDNSYLYVPQQTLVTFTFNPATGIVQTSPTASGFSTSCLPQVVVTGSLQHEFGCGDWDANCLNTALTYSFKTGKFENDFTLQPGYYEYRIIQNGDWAGNNFGSDGTAYGSNYTFSLQCVAKVHFSYDPLTHLVTTTPTFIPETKTVVVAGSFQSEVGCSGDWQPDCNITRMHLDPYGAWVSDTLQIPAGDWQYKFTFNNSWDYNYGGDSVLLLHLCSPSKVIFYLYHNDCYNTNYNYQEILPSQPNTVVIAGSFQSELGCSSDWQPDCQNTRMKYDPLYGAWVDTLMIPAGSWQYKFTLNNSWDENYGLGGVRDGDNISLDLCYPAKVVFYFYYGACYANHYAYIITNGVCVNKFYDANLNGYQDPGEEPMGDVKFTLSGNGITQTQTTGTDGKAAFSNLPDGFYVIKENVPSGYYSSGIDSQFVYLFGNAAVANFGNVCIGPGGAKGVGFWTSKNGEAALKSGGLEDALWQLRNFSLRNADGSDFDPYTYQQLTTWLKGANAKNMTYMLSSQLAAMFLNIQLGYVTYDRYIYTPGCTYWGNFMNVYSLIWYTNYYLMNKTSADGKDPERGYLECLKNAFDNANNNLTFVQPHPCTGTITKTEKNTVPEVGAILPTARIWPNPSNNYFTLRPANVSNHETVRLKVYNVNGQEAYSTQGFSDRDYRFGERFAPGVYMVELVQGNNRSTFKLVKQ
jgi:pullulanase-like protein/SdrD B-like protein/type IX secretion system substrate protein